MHISELMEWKVWKAQLSIEHQELHPNLTDCTFKDEEVRFFVFNAEDTFTWKRRFLYDFIILLRIQHLFLGAHMIIFTHWADRGGLGHRKYSPLNFQKDIPLTSASILRSKLQGACVQSTLAEIITKRKCCIFWIWIAFLKFKEAILSTLYSCFYCYSAFSLCDCASFLTHLVKCVRKPNLSSKTTLQKWHSNVSPLPWQPRWRT